MKTSFLGMMAAMAALALPAAAQTQSQPAGQSSGSQNLENPGSAFRGDGRRANWHIEVEKTERGYRIGNPEAGGSLIEFISYTCSHCADFARQGEGAMDLVLLSPGIANLEIRPVIRNGLDLTISLLVQCGGTEGFKERHRMFLFAQASWLEKARTAPQAQQAIWARGDRASRINAATALDFDDMLADKGISRTDINTCLADDQAALALIRSGNADREEFAVPGTPAFALDGKLLDGVHSWQQLYPVLAQRFRPEPVQDGIF